MHYEIKNGFGLKMDIDTMKPLKDVSPEVEIGQRTAMSPLDVEKVNEMYKCPSKEEKCITKSGNCTFPFKYWGVTYHICTDDYAYYSWCATKTSGKEHDYIRGQWDYCPKSCFRCGQSNFMKTSCGGTNINYTRESKQKNFRGTHILLNLKGGKVWTVEEF
ncbi:uncharacterized protein [Lepeophtheirus salmonis]|uniref:uncharacterized protein n=1 Tax=Lepeophtheirus salmonis TaxID=72036 RepID=UPI001AE3122D|nr:uncharacterized protein LOC121126176 [Lepeophtheirus salmonis]